MQPREKVAEQRVYIHLLYICTAEEPEKREERAEKVRRSDGN